MSICLIDTSVFCNLLRVPGRDQHHEEVTQQIATYIKQRVTRLLPIASIIETGNHIAHVGDGQVRRKVASLFVQQVTLAIDGTPPWATTPSFDTTMLREYLPLFPDHAMRGIGLGDLSIIEEYNRQCVLHRMRRVFIWSYDRDLAVYDRSP